MKVLRRELRHIGTETSGRYPKGSGDNPEQRHKSFLGNVNKLKKEGLSESEIAKGYGLRNSTELRRKISIANTEIQKAKISQVTKLKAAGLSNTAISKETHIPEATVRSILKKDYSEKVHELDSTVNLLKKSVDEKGYIDIGHGTEAYLGIKRTKLQTAISMLENEGYTQHALLIDQLGTQGKKTKVTVLAGPGKTIKDVAENRDKISVINAYSDDGGQTYRSIEPPKSIKSDRVFIKYNEDGGVEKDGVIELRRGVEDLSLKKARYAQVRIGVDDTHYLKGMAVYSDDIPKGYDIVFNTNKKRGTPKMDVLKEMDLNTPDNPFGAVTRQSHYIDKNGKEQLSVLNICREEGEWSTFSKTLASQFLGKQPKELVKKQLGIVIDEKLKEYNDILKIDNPVVKARLLKEFGDSCDSAAVHLEGGPMQRQSYHVILPLNNIKPNEVYAPNFNNGERIVLIRYPHAGTFEIPELIVNNKNKEAKSFMENAKDAVGIHHTVAEKLSGADFDGDFVITIPNNDGSIKTSASLKELENFDPKSQYKYWEGMKVMTPKAEGSEMGSISNLITDMTIKGAGTDEIVRAVKHSMVVIDAKKHKLDYKKSAEENQIAALKTKYQGSARAGASTLLSKATSEKRVDDRREIAPDPITGEKRYKYSGKKYVIDGKEYTKMIASTKMAEEKDAFKLSSGTQVETIYALHANKLKALANTARKEMVGIKKRTYSPNAKVVYDKEVKSLMSKLLIAEKNAPLERQAQLIGGLNVAAIKKNNPTITKADLKKEKGKQLILARSRTGALKKRVNITPEEWEAIQAGAVSNNVLNKILDNSDMDVVKQLATPKSSTYVPETTMTRARVMLNNGHSQAEVASALGVSVSALSKALT